MLISFAILALSPSWFGPSTVDASFSVQGNPFSPTENDVRCVFTQGSRRLERFAYFAHDRWHAVLADEHGGTYKTQFLLNGKKIGEPSSIKLSPTKTDGFVRLDGIRFKFSSGKPYIPFGHDFGWQNGNDASYPKQLADMGAAGLNWTRVWAESWDGKNPYFPPDEKTKLELGRMYEPALDRWDMVIDNCEKDDIKLQFVLFHHGLFSTTVNPNWPQHPWNKANGGFLADPTDYFVDPTAKTLTKAWLRYAVARWGHSPAIMAWELFNEVQWVDAIKVHPDRIGDVVAWHKEMGDYLRSIDPYHHLVTSSSSESLDPRIFATMDYLQPHTYPPSIYGAMLGTAVPKDRPLFYGEFGPGSDSAPQASAVRDGFWGGLLDGQAGPGQYWYWDRAYKSNLYPEYAKEKTVLVDCGFAEHPNAKPAPIEVTGGAPSDLELRPGRGWGKSEKFDYDLPKDGGLGALPLLSGYLQGTKSVNRANMNQQPLHFRFVSKSAGVARVRISQVSKGGGSLSVGVNGGTPVVKDWPAGTAESNVHAEVSVPVAAGANDVIVDNPGSDWVVLDSVTLPGAGAGVSAACLRTDDYALARLQWAKEFGPGAKTVTIPGLGDGTYELRQYDIDRGAKNRTRVNVVGGKIAGYKPFALDEGIALLKIRTIHITH